MDQELIASLVGASIGLFVCCTACIVCRIWRRNRYYKKVQKSLDEEEAAFQETLARNFRDERQLDAEDQAKLNMLESYVATAGGEAGAATDAPLPASAEDVDKFMSALAAAAAGDSGLPPAKEGDDNV